jgi:hypothetical protein
VNSSCLLENADTSFGPTRRGSRRHPRVLNPLMVAKWKCPSLHHCVSPSPSPSPSPATDPDQETREPRLSPALPLRYLKRPTGCFDGQASSSRSLPSQPRTTHPRDSACRAWRQRFRSCTATRPPNGRPLKRLTPKHPPPTGAARLAYPWRVFDFETAEPCRSVFRRSIACLPGRKIAKGGIADMDGTYDMDLRKKRKKERKKERKGVDD